VLTRSNSADLVDLDLGRIPRSTAARTRRRPIISEQQADSDSTRNRRSLLVRVPDAGPYCILLLGGEPFVAAAFLMGYYRGPRFAVRLLLAPRYGRDARARRVRVLGGVWGVGCVCEGCGGGREEACEGGGGGGAEATGATGTTPIVTAA